MVPRQLRGVVAPEALAAVVAAYRREWKMGVYLIDPTGKVIGGMVGGGKKGMGDSLAWRDLRRLALSESLRWGEPVIETGLDNTLLWAVPLMINNKLVAGLMAWVPERRVFAPDSLTPHMDLQRAAADLRGLAEEHNLTNAALLAQHRIEADKERTRAEAIHAFKTARGSSVRGAYLLEEPALLAAIRSGDQAAARSILNRLLVQMISLAGTRRDLVKSLFLELVVSLTRSAVEAGAAPQELLGPNFSGMATLAGLEDDEAISAWLRQTLDRVLEAIARKPQVHRDPLEERALAYLDEHCTQQISRAGVAKALGVSASHLARTLSACMGKSIPEIVAHLRVHKAAEWLARTDRPLKLIALQSGFRDQSYFTKVFQKLMHVTPRRYRMENARGFEPQRAKRTQRLD